MQENRTDDIKPDALMADIAKPRLIPCFGISFAVHIVMLLLLSITFLGNCFKYGTIHPRAAMKQEAKELKEKQAEEERQNLIKRAEEAAKKKKAAAEQQQKETQGAAASTSSIPAGMSPDEARMKEIEAKAKAEGKEVPEMIRILNETSDERPETSDLSLEL